MCGLRRTTTPLCATVSIYPHAETMRPFASRILVRLSTTSEFLHGPEELMSSESCGVSRDLNHQFDLRCPFIPKELSIRVYHLQGIYRSHWLKHHQYFVYIVEKRS